MIYCVCGNEFERKPPYCPNCGNREFTTCHNCILAEQLDGGIPATMTPAERLREAKVTAPSTAHGCLGKGAECQAVTIEAHSYRVLGVGEYCLFDLMDEWKAGQPPILNY